ncbi:STAS domain-containing protein [Spirillospora sp. NPDC048911]|uniref:STAS domain-containing protein n=1 Tax=Spirillospora sp. NPDC048911 TaxID=3364527 RepID=UPI00371B5954
MRPPAPAIEHRDDHCVVAVHGLLDITKQSELDDVLTTARQEDKDLIVDMSDVTFMDTRCMAVLIRHWKRQTTRGHRLILVGATYKTIRALWITGLDQHIPHTDTLDQALRSLADPA